MSNSKNVKSKKKKQNNGLAAIKKSILKNKAPSVPSKKLVQAVAQKPQISAAPVAYGRVASNRDPIITTRDGVTTIAKSEYVTDIPSTQEFDVATFAINPANSLLFPWLSTQAVGYTQFKFKELVFRLVSTAKTGDVGNWMLNVLWDSLETVFATKGEFLNYGDATEGNLWKDVIFKCSKAAMSYFNKYFNYVNGTIPPTADPKTYNVGMLTVANSKNAADAAPVIGELHVDYVVEMAVPNVQGMLLSHDQGYWWYYGNNQSFGLLQGITSNYGIELVTDITPTKNNFRLKFTHWGEGQEYIVMVQALATASMSGYISLSPAVVTGATVVQADLPAANGRSSDWNGTCGAGYGSLSFMYITPTQDVVTFTGITSNITTATTKFILLVSPVAPDPVIPTFPAHWGMRYGFTDTGNGPTLNRGKLRYKMPHHRPYLNPLQTRAEIKSAPIGYHFDHVKRFSDDIDEEKKKNALPASHPAAQVSDSVAVGWQPGDNPSDFKMSANSDGSLRTYTRVVLADGTVVLKSDPKGQYHVASKSDDEDYNVV